MFLSVAITNICHAKALSAKNTVSLSDPEVSVTMNLVTFSVAKIYLILVNLLSQCFRHLKFFAWQILVMATVRNKSRVAVAASVKALREATCTYSELSLAVLQRAEPDQPKSAF